MKLSKLSIHNFRSIDHLDIAFGALTTFVGKNSVGKSNLLKALQFFFTFTAKGADARDRSRFAAEGEPTWVECTFDSLSVAELANFAKYRLPDASLMVRRTLDIDGTSVTTALRGYVAVATDPWLAEDYEGYANTARWAEIGVNPLDYAPAGARGGITRQTFNAFREAYIAKHPDRVTWRVQLADTAFQGRESTAAVALPHFIYVPSVGDIVPVIYGKQASLMNQVVASVVDSAKGLPEYVQAQRSLVDAQDFVNPSIRRLPRLRAIEQHLEAALASWPNTRVTIRTEVPDLAELLVTNLVIHIDDGTDGDLSQKGDGMQRQVLFQVFRLYADFKGLRGLFAPAEGAAAERRPAIVAFEEPELFLHPQAQEQFYDDLLTVSATDQVVLSTHSVHLVRVDAIDGVHILRKASADAPTRIVGVGKDLLAPDEYDRLKEVNLLNAEVSKVFFADKVIIVEGPEDAIYLLKTAADHARCLERRVTIVVTNAKGSIPTMQRVLHRIQVPYVAVVDEDPGNAVSAGLTRKVREAAAEGAGAGLGAQCELFSPCLPSVCRGAAAPTVDKPFEAHRFMHDSRPTPEFIERVKSMMRI